MDRFHSSVAQVVLEVKEGNGFNFLNNPVVLVASFGGKKLETKEILPSTYPYFGTELVWQADTKYLRKLRTSNTAFKLECFTVVSYNNQEPRRERLGYILLNLKEAQLVAQDSSTPVPESWHRVLGLKHMTKSYRPEILLMFKIEEMSKMESRQTDVKVEGKLKDGLKFVGMNYQSKIGTPPNDNSPLQIGPTQLCTELYELTLSVLSIGNKSNFIPEDNPFTPFKLHFFLFGISFFSDEIYSFENSVKKKTITIKISSRLDFLTAYFKEFSNLDLNLYSNSKVVGGAMMDLKVLGNLQEKGITTINVKLPVHSVDTQEIVYELNFTYMEVELNLFHMKDLIITKIDQETQLNYVFEGGDPPFSDFSTKQVNSVNQHAIFTEENMAFQQIEPDNREVNLQLPKEHSDSQRTPEPIKLTDMSEFVLKSPPSQYAPSSDVPEMSKEYVREATVRACEELEDWKEKQQEMYKFELKKKTDRHLKKLSNEWIKRKRDLEDDLKKRIEECQDLKEKLNVALLDLTERSERLAQKEDEVKTAREELDKNYTAKFQELRKASKLHEYDMEDKVNDIILEKTEILSKLDESEKEILRLQQALLNQESVNFVPREQADKLIKEIRGLEKKLEKAVESKTFFKEQWGKAVRELHRIKEEEQQHLKWQIQKNKHELHTLGLVKEISQEVGEMKKDQSTIKNIRNELMTNFVSTTERPCDLNNIADA